MSKSHITDKKSNAKKNTKQQQTNKLFGSYFQKKLISTRTNSKPNYIPNFLNTPQFRDK